MVLNFRKAGAVLKGDVNRLKAHLQEMNEQEMNKLVELVKAQKEVEIEGFPKLSYDMFEIKLTPKDEFAIANLGNNLVVLDLEISQDLVNEGKLRELIREIQVARKEANFNIDDRIALCFETRSEAMQKIIADNLDTINKEVLAVSNKSDKYDFEKELDFDDDKVVIKMAK